MILYLVYGNYSDGIELFGVATTAERAKKIKEDVVSRRIATEKRIVIEEIESDTTIDG